MQITKIEKKKRLYLVELDSQDKLYVTEDTIVRFMLSKGTVLTESQLAEVQTYAQFSYGKNLALYHLSFKQRTVKEVQDYLVKHEIEEEIISQVIADLETSKWLDDRKYAQTFIEQNLLSGDKGPYALKQKLAQKGLPLGLLEELLLEADFSLVAVRVVEKSWRKYEGRLPTKGLKDKLTQILVTKGFSYADANAALSQITIEKDEETEQELIVKELDKQYRKYSRQYEGYELKQRLTQALARKGYDYGDIASALREYL